MDTLFSKQDGFYSTAQPIRKDHRNRTLLLSDLPDYKNVLLLQGPVGPFFKKLAHYWLMRGASVTKVNFNSGDDYFYPPDSDKLIQFKSRFEFWPKYLSNLLTQRGIKAIFLFGDCRKIHQPARSISALLGIDLYVFEEGYIRPHLFTLEKNGVNYSSFLSKISIESICDSVESHNEPSIQNRFNRSFWYMVRWSIIYWFINLINQSHYPNYTHHRTLDLSMGFKWIKSFFRYWIFRIIDKRKRNRLFKTSYKNSANRKLFFLPLQVHDDSQMVTHSDFESIEEVIEIVISSFANHIQNTRRNDSLVIKHHPMDRGHKNYQRFINELVSLYKIKAHIIYVHDISVPDLLNQCSGCVTVNSTIGIQAMNHGVPTINLGRSFYDKPGLTFQGELDQFWSNPSAVNTRIVKAFRNFLLHHTQVNGSLYDPNYECR